MTEAVAWMYEKAGGRAIQRDQSYMRDYLIGRGWTETPLYPAEALRARDERIAELEGQLVAQWQPIETAPKDDAWILCWGPDCGQGIAKFGPNPCWAEYPEYTHWMPLPTPPALKEKNDDA